MRSRALQLLVTAVVVVALGSVLIGLARPDGAVRGSVAPADRAPASMPSPSASTPPASSTATVPPSSDTRADRGPDLAPLRVAGTWPGAPKGVVEDDGSTDWCGAVKTTGAAEAVALFGRAAVDAAACAAVTFVFEHRYSRLSLPRRAYEADDFDTALLALDPRTAETVYRPRVAQFVTGPGSDTAGEQLGLVLFTGRATAAGADYAAAGSGHVFYGPAFTTKGYRDRAVWIDPTWSTVTIGVDRTMSQPRIEARLTASASIPVWSTTSRRDAMMTIPTRARFTLRAGDAAQWRIDGWTIGRGGTVYAPLSIN